MGARGLEALVAKRCKELRLGYQGLVELILCRRAL